MIVDISLWLFQAISHLEFILPWSKCCSIFCHEISIQTVCETVYFTVVVKIFHWSKICVYVRLDFFFRWVFNNNEEEKNDKTVFLLLAFLQANYEELHLSKDSSDSFCLTVRYRRYLGQDWTLPAVPGTRHRYRNRTLPWSLPPVPQVPLQLYGNQALV